MMINQKINLRLKICYEQLMHALQENNENAKAAVTVFKHFGEVSRKAKAAEMSKDGYL